MPLLEHQIVLGRCLRAAGGDPLASLAADPLQGIGFDRAELAELDDLVHSSGFCFTRRGQRSWCEGRTAQTAQLTLSILSTEQRRQLVDDWVDAGGGAAFDPASEAEAFLEFVAGRLSDPSHAMTVCRMEQTEQAEQRCASRRRTCPFSTIPKPCSEPARVQLWCGSLPSRNGSSPLSRRKRRFRLCPTNAEPIRDVE
jgi:hypothetical protein